MEKRTVFIVSSAILLIIAVIMVVGFLFFRKPPNVVLGAIQKCANLCQERKSENKNLSSGPCLSNEIEKDWVCDVAHNPKQQVDYLPANQCDAFRTGKARHFVEVDENCNFINKN